MAADLRLPLWCLAVGLIACAPSDFDSVERTRLTDPSTDPCDRGVDAAGCAMPPTDASVSEDAGGGAGDASAPPPDASGCVMPVCKPGEMSVESGRCGACDTGMRTRTRRCRSDGCGYEEPSAWSTCSGVTAVCEPKAVSACENNDQCGERVCTAECKWSACQPKKGNECLDIGRGHKEGGTNYECCGDGKWHFCVPGCVWSTECIACDARFCEC